MNAVIGYDNHAPDAATVTASNEATGFDAENAYDWIPATQWKPGATGSQTLAFNFGSPVAVDYVGIAAHNLGSQGASIQFQYLAGSWTDLIGTITPSDDKPIFRTFNSQSDTDFRIQITNCTVNTVIGVLAFGQRLDLDQSIEPGDWAPPPLADVDEINTNRSDEGVFLARSVKRQGIEGQIMQRYLSQSWVRANWPAFAEHAKGNPFFYSWDDLNYEDDAALVWVPEKIKPPRFMSDSPLFMEFDLKVMGNY